MLPHPPRYLKPNCVKPLVFVCGVNIKRNQNDIKRPNETNNSKTTKPRQSKRKPKELSEKIASIDKSKGVEVASLFDHGNTQTSEYNSFKEEMRSMLKDINQTISKNVGTTIAKKN